MLPEHSSTKADQLQRVGALTWLIQWTLWQRLQTNSTLDRPLLLSSHDKRPEERIVAIVHKNTFSHASLRYLVFISLNSARGLLYQGCPSLWAEILRRNLRE